MWPVDNEWEEPGAGESTARLDLQSSWVRRQRMEQGQSTFKGHRKTSAAGSGAGPES